VQSEADSGVLGFVRGTLPAPPARVLEVGAGDGALAAALRADGYDVVAVDPEPGGPAVEAVALLDVPDGAFDAAVAVVSLHHVEPLEESCRRLAELVRPGGLLVVDELDCARYDERAARWWLQHKGGLSPFDRRDPAEMVADLRGHVHPLAAVRAALEPWFELSAPVRGPYLHRWSLPPGLRPSEEAAIAGGELPAVGVRFTGVSTRAA
jgi:SAM-dependent methyltransferase